MDSFFFYLIRITLLVALLIPRLAGGYPAPAIQQHPEQAAESLDALKKTIKQIEISLNEKQKEESEALSALEALETRIGENSEKLRTIQKNIKIKEQELVALEEKSDKLSQTHQAEQAALAEQMAARFKTFKKEKLQLFFGQHDLTRLLRVKHYYNYFNQARKAYLDALTLATRETIDARLSVKKEQENLKLLESERLHEEQNLKSDKTSRTNLLKEINTALSTQKANLSQMKRQEKMLTELTQSLQKKITKFSLPEPNLPFAKMKGKLLSPIQGNQYSLKTLAKTLLKDKKSVYLGATEGTEVRAIYEGRVVFADWLRGLGQLLIIDHGNGFMSLYGYNQILYKMPGDTVKTGEKISLVGQSGGQAKPGLYFEIRKDGDPLDPTPWFQA
ncbi:MAG: peptidoglycan DD-metalloendopeptidase family protein [Gammaproteobacteria bacterium]